MNGQFEIPQNALNEAIEKTLLKGELGEKIADRLANIYAEVTSYNRTDAAKLLNIARSTLYEYEIAKQITFRADGRISLASLRDFQRGLVEVNEDADDKIEISRKSNRVKKRSVKK